MALRELHKILEGILEDGKVSLSELDSLCYWMEEHRDLSGNYPFDKAFDALDHVLEDGMITDHELEELKTIFEEIVDPVKTQKCCEQISALAGKHICLTGEFNYGTKNSVEQLIIGAGGAIDKGVKKSTDFVIVGAKGNDAWKAGNYGAKIQKAMEWNAKGMNIKIIEEVEFIPEIQRLLDQP